MQAAAEMRMSISDLDSVLDMMSSGNPSYTGKLVSPRNAMGVPAVWACVNLIADDFATLPLKTYRWDDTFEDRNEARDHYLWPLFMEEANPRMSYWEFKRAMETWRLLWGNCYAELDINGRGQIMAIWPWRPDRVKVILLDPDDPRSDVLYVYQPMKPGAQPIAVPSDRMLHVRHATIDGIVGLSPIEIHRQQVGLQMAMQEFSGRFYSNGAWMSRILEHPGKLGEKATESLRNSMKMFHEGLSNAHRFMILEEGMKVSEVGMPLTDAQFIESQNYNVTEMARIYKIPPHKVQQLDNATNNNIEQQSIEYIQMTLMPVNSNWCARIHSSMLSQRDRQTVFAESDYSHLLRGDSAGRAQWARAMQGVLSLDELRRKEGYNALPKKLGKLPRVALNTKAIDDTSKPQPPQPAGAGDGRDENQNQKGDKTGKGNGPDGGNKKKNGAYIQ